MTARKLRQKFLQFFESKGHSQYPSGSLIPYDATGRLDESLLFNGAGMIQFKPFFRGIATPPDKRLVSAQKCVRTGDIDEVGDLTHNTFFEMLGNFGFGDYFKQEAIDFSWEFNTSSEWLGLDPKRISYTIFEDDNDAYDAWAPHVRQEGMEPETRIFRLGEDTNYWPAGALTKGPPGLCGPNSEMFYWVSSEEAPPSGNYSRDDFVRDEAAGKWLEFWNDVFIQYEWKGHLRNPDRQAEGYVKDGLDTLPFKSIDTGMGVERTSVVLGGFKSNYDTDVFTPVIAKIEEISRGRIHYEGTLGPVDNAVRVVADHIRTACFCIADGVLPANNGRGYVLRRLIRRAVLKGQRVLGFTEPFFYQVYDGVVAALGDHYHELTERRDVILETINNEEELFRRTLNSGYTILQEELARLSGKVLPGDMAFKLYDTYGFPLEVTKEIMAEQSRTVDELGYEKSLAEAQERSRAGTERETVYGGGNHHNILWIEPGETPTFVGYDRTKQESRVVSVAEGHGEPGDNDLGPILIGLKETPFYTQSGGQVSDTGFLEILGLKLPVEKMVKVNGQPFHSVRPKQGMLEARSPERFAEAIKGAPATAVVEENRRRSIIRNHSATHLLHAALRKVLGKHVTQAGSLVAPDHLRFDFTHGKAMTDVELAEVERIVNERALESLPVTIHTDVPIARAKEMGAMALFGEKYGDKVRVVQMDGFSLELCGGIHVRSTSEIGLFRIVSEGSAASGVRRIEAITGEKAYERVLRDNQVLLEAASILKSSPTDLVAAVERTISSLREEKRKVEKMRTHAAGENSASAETVGDLEFLAQRLDEGDADEAKLVADRLTDGNPRRVSLVAVVNDGKITLVCKAGPDAIAKGAHAGKLVGEAARVAGGGGGGRPDFATAGAKNPEKLDEALAAAKQILLQQIGKA
jgi:alanyl-tRNA synthetase